MDFLWLKVLHILSAILVLGTGLGIAFFMWTAHRTGDPRVIAAVARNVVIADAIFTAPGVIGLLITGLLMTNALGLSLFRGWIGLALALFIVTGLCWLPVLVLQKMAWRLAERAHAAGTPLPPAYRTVMRWWFWLGWPAFAAVITIVGLMVLKPAL
jgi:uncharacterized membrane protein